MKSIKKENLIERFEKNQKDAFNFYREEISRSGLDLTKVGTGTNNQYD